MAIYIFQALSHKPIESLASNRIVRASITTIYRLVLNFTQISHVSVWNLHTILIIHLTVRKISGKNQADTDNFKRLVSHIVYFVPLYVHCFFLFSLFNS